MHLLSVHFRIVGTFGKWFCFPFGKFPLFIMCVQKYNQIKPSIYFFWKTQWHQSFCHVSCVIDAMDFDRWTHSVYLWQQI